MHVRVRLHGDLRALASPAGDGDVEVAVPEPRSVKDVVEALGIPHTELAHLAVDGRAVGFDRRLVGGERVEAHPPGAATTPRRASVLPGDPPARFVCDVHLGTLARRLRLLGFDTWYRNDADDPELARVAVAERRVLLSRDRGLLSRRVIVHGYLPRADDPDVQLSEVVRRFDLAGRTRSLTRCVRCNGTLEAVPATAVADRVPPRSRRAFDRFARCRSCGQAYWPGSHTEALRAVTDEFGQPPPSSW